jgi:hypothetical protein
MNINSMEYNEHRMGMPPQKLTKKAKNKGWWEQCINAVSMNTSDTGTIGRSTKENKQVNYDIVNSIYNKKGFKYLTNQSNIDDKLLSEFGGMPTILRLHNIIRPKLELLKGEESRRPFSWSVVGAEGEVINEKLAKKEQDILGVLMQMMMANLGVASESEEITLEQVNQKHRVAGIDIRERNSARILEAIWREQNLKFKFTKGLAHAMISSEQLYFIGKHNGKPYCRVVDPLNSEFDKNPDLDFVEDGDWFSEKRLMTIASIIDEFILTDEQIKRLDSGQVKNSYSPYHNGDYLPTFGEASSGNLGTQWEDFGRPSEDNYFPYKQGQSYTDTKIEVTTCVWRSLRKIGYLTHPDGNQEMVMDDQFHLTQEMRKKGYTLEWDWITEICKGTRIGGDMYVEYGPLENQTGKLPYVGYVHNNLNSKATSLVDLVREHQYTYMEIWYKLMLELAKAKGKKIILDQAQMPGDMDPNKWLYYYDILGIVWVNSMEEGDGVFAGQRPSYNQFQMLDQSITSNINNYILMLNKVEDMIGDVLGVSPQREGAISSNETVGGVERSVNQSSLITEPLFIEHNMVKKNVLSQLLEMALLCMLEDNSPVQLLVDDSFREMIVLEAEKMNDSRYKVEISDSSEDYAMIQALKGLAQAAIQNQAASLSEIGKLHRSKSGSDIIGSLKRWEDEQQQRQQQQQQAEQEMQKMLADKEEARYNAELSYKIEKDRLDREARIQEATIMALRGKDGPSDMNMNGIPDPIEAGKLALEQQKAGTQQLIEQMKLDLEGQKQQTEEAKRQSQDSLERERMALDKYKVDAEFQKQAMENNQQNKHKAIDVQENAKDRKLKEKELAKKAQMEKYKVKNKPKPKPTKKK